MTTHRAELATRAVFVVHAAVLGFWSVQIPAVARHASLHDGQLGLALAAEPVGAGLVMIIVGSLVQRFGSGCILRWAIVPYAVTTAAIGLCTSLPALAVTLCLWGATMAVINIAMNAQGLVVEAAADRPVLVKLHGWWSLGAFTGATLGSLIGTEHSSVSLRMGTTALAVLAVLAISSTALLPGVTTDLQARRRGFVRPDARLVGLSIIAFCSLLCEGAVLTWSALFLTNTVHVAASASGFGYAAYALAMAVGRLCGDRVLNTVGIARTLTIAAAGAAAAMLVGLYTDQQVVTIASFAFLGMGLSYVMPVVTRSAGMIGGVLAAPAIALVQSSGWLGVVAGPPLIGWAAALSSLRIALGALVLFPCVIAILVPVMLRGIDGYSDVEHMTDDAREYDGVPESPNAIMTIEKELS